MVIEVAQADDDFSLTQPQVVAELQAHMDASMANRKTWDDGTPFRVLAVESAVHLEPTPVTEE